MKEKLSTTSICETLAIPRSIWYRHTNKFKSANEEKTIRRNTARSLSEEEKVTILSVLNTEQYRDCSPEEVHASLLDKRIYLCSVRTMYRLLEKQGQNTPRYQRSRKNRPVPQLLTTKPNTLWSWDITKLFSPVKWTYYYLYTIIDVYSRFVVGWMVSFKENAVLAKELIQETILRQEIVPGTLTIHADRGSPMKSKTVAQLLIYLGVEKTHGRPHVSNDNPYSESAFKTIKYHSTFPHRFGCIEDARKYCKEFYDWYNYNHHHSGIAMLTPFDVHWGNADKILNDRKRTLDIAYNKHPERFTKGRPKTQHLEREVWINKPGKTVSENEKILAKTF